VRQLLRAVERHGSDKKLLAFKHSNKVLVAVRNAAEHWDDQKASDRLAALTSGSWGAYTFTTGSSGTVIAGVLRVDDLEEWADQVQRHLLQAERDWR